MRKENGFETMIYEKQVSICKAFANPPEGSGRGHNPSRGQTSLLLTGDSRGKAGLSIDSQCAASADTKRRATRGMKLFRFLQITNPSHSPGSRGEA